MPRKVVNRNKKDIAMKPELMPFQTKPRGWGKSPMQPTGPLSQIELAISALPIFGGTSTETKTESSSTEGNTDQGKSSEGGTDSGGGDSSKEITPEQLAQLTTQVQTLTSANTELQNQLNSFTSKEDETRRAAQGREETLSEDLTAAQQTIDKMDKVIKSLAVVNAIQGNPNLQFHNPNDVIARLDHTAYKLDVDLDGGTAKVSGIENELTRIAKENDYLVVKPTLDDGSSKPPPRRSTGNPPGPQPTNSTKADRRKALEAKWPVIASGRRATLG